MREMAMEALLSSSSKIFTADHYHTVMKKKTLQAATATRSGISFVESLNTNLPCLNLSQPRHATKRRTIHALTPSNSQVELGMDTSESGIQEIDPSKTAHVKFQLQKECSFGEHYLIVGNDPILGCWNPTSAIPLNWSDGNIWTVELDVPINKCIRYKFLLKSSTGDVSWQPGPDRFFRPWETKNPVIVSEDWESAEVLQISEEQDSNQNEEALYIDPFVIEETSYLSEEFVPALNNEVKVSVSDNISYAADTPIVHRSRELPPGEDNAYHKESALIDAERTANRTVGNVEEQEMPGRENSQTSGGTDENSVDSEEDEETFITCDEGPVLVPGLTLRLPSSERAVAKETQKSMLSDAALGADAPTNQIMPEMHC
ncbi:hypothetical protein Ancab_007392 [Ancistrocladus abbreviatus]